MAELLRVEHRCLREIVPRRRAVEASFPQVNGYRRRLGSSDERLTEPTTVVTGLAFAHLEPTGVFGH